MPLFQSVNKKVRIPNFFAFPPDNLPDCNYNQNQLFFIYGR